LFVVPLPPLTSCILCSLNINFATVIFPSESFVFPFLNSFFIIFVFKVIKIIYTTNVRQGFYYFKFWNETPLWRNETALFGNETVFEGRPCMLGAAANTLRLTARACFYWQVGHAGRY
jgi:hypothetical protein